MNNKLRVAIVQWSPVHLNLKECTSKAEKAIREAASEGAQLVVFGETWFSGYPAWLDYCTNVAFWDHPPMKKVYARFLDNALSREGAAMRSIMKAARTSNVNLIIGANEIDRSVGKGTVFNSLFFIDDQGTIRNVHRKLMPTYTERLLHKQGDGHGLQSVEMAGVRVTGAICWEHWMPLTRQALHNEGEELHIAAWPKVHEMHQVASRQYAFEGRCYVLAAGQMYHSSDFPDELEKPESLMEKDEWVLNGGSCIIGPDGSYVREPVFDKETILYADLDLQRTKEESLTLDTSGHYQRGDVFGFSVDRTRR